METCFKWILNVKLKYIHKLFQVNSIISIDVGQNPIKWFKNVRKKGMFRPSITIW